MKLKITKLVLIIFLQVVYSQSIWNLQNSGSDRFLFDVHFIDQNNGWVCGQTGTILHTSNGGLNWIDQNAPPSNYYSGIQFLNDQVGWAVGFSGRLIKTIDGGQNWNIEISPAQYSISDLEFFNDNLGWTVGGKARSFTDPIREILHTTNGGNDWTTQYIGSNEEPLASVHFVDENHGWAVGSASTIMKTTNGGENWLIQMTGAGYEFNDVYFMNENTGWVVGQDLSLQHLAVIFKTTDGGSNWDIQTFGSDDSFSSIQFVDDNTGWVAGGSNTEAIILHTTDSGDTWNYISSTGTSNFLSGLHFADQNNGWAVGFNGTIIHTENVVPVELTSFTASLTDNTVTLNWETATETNNSGFEIQRSLAVSKYKRIGFVSGNGTITERSKYSFTDELLAAGNYLYRLVQVDLDGTRNEMSPIEVNVGANIPTEFNLSQNYPNPFNPTTTISYVIPAVEKGHAPSLQTKLIVFDILGKEVTTLVNETKAPGTYEVNFNAANLPSGIYFYKLSSGNFSDTKKMMLLK